MLVSEGLPIEGSTGGRTKYNRTIQHYPKAHWIDAAWVGKSGTQVNRVPSMVPLVAKAQGHGSRQMCVTDRYGFPKQHRGVLPSRSILVLQTG